MKERADLYRRAFNFRHARDLDIEGWLTGLKGKAMTSPCGKVRIPIDESSDGIYTTTAGMKQQAVEVCVHGVSIGANRPAQVGGAVLAMTECTA